MLHTTRVSAWVIILATWAEMLMTAMATIIYYGVLHDDPNTAALAGLAALSTGSIALIILTGLWMGITINVANCPAMVQPPAARHYPDMSTLNADTRAIYVGSDRTEWTLHYSAAQWRGLSKMLQDGYNNLPYRPCYRYAGLSRQDWDQLRIDMVRAGLARKHGNEVLINEEGKRAIYKFAAAALPQREDG